MAHRQNDRRDDRPSRSGTPAHVSDQEIQKWILRQHGFFSESAWIADCKEQLGLAAPGTASQENPCPPERVAAIKQALRRFGLV
jgi:hypothetical protein